MQKKTDNSQVEQLSLQEALSNLNIMRKRQRTIALVLAITAVFILILATMQTLETPAEKQQATKSLGFFNSKPGKVYVSDSQVLPSVHDFLLGSQEQMILRLKQTVRARERDLSEIHDLHQSQLSMETKERERVITKLQEGIRRLELANNAQEALLIQEKNRRLSLQNNEQEHIQRITELHNRMEQMASFEQQYLREKQLREQTTARYKSLERQQNDLAQVRSALSDTRQALEQEKQRCLALQQQLQDNEKEHKQSVAELQSRIEHLAIFEEQYIQEKQLREQHAIRYELLAQQIDQQKLMLNTLLSCKQEIESKQPTQRTHIVQAGDSLSALAQRYYGTTKAWQTIYLANQDRLPNPNQLPLGITLTIPDHY